MNEQQLWQNEFGLKTKAQDFAGREIHKDEYGTGSKYSWDIDHIRPLAKNGSDSVDNMQIVHQETNDEKGDLFPTFKIGNEQYQAKKLKNASPSEWANEYNYSHKKYCIVKL